MFFIRFTFCLVKVWFFFISNERDFVDALVASCKFYLRHLFFYCWRCEFHCRSWFTVNNHHCISTAYVEVTVKIDAVISLS